MNLFSSGCCIEIGHSFREQNAVEVLLARVGNNSFSPQWFKLSSDLLSYPLLFAECSLQVINL
jgi:hypothetical protein